MAMHDLEEDAPLLETLRDTVRAINELLDATDGKPADAQLKVLRQALLDVADEFNDWQGNRDSSGIAYVGGIGRRMADRQADLNKRP